MVFEYIYLDWGIAGNEPVVGWNQWAVTREPVVRWNQWWDGTSGGMEPVTLEHLVGWNH